MIDEDEMYMPKADVPLHINGDDFCGARFYNIRGLNFLIDQLQNKPVIVYRKGNIPTWLVTPGNISIDGSVETVDLYHFVRENEYVLHIRTKAGTYWSYLAILVEIEKFEQGNSILKSCTNTE